MAGLTLHKAQNLVTGVLAPSTARATSLSQPIRSPCLQQSVQSQQRADVARLCIRQQRGLRTTTASSNGVTSSGSGLSINLAGLHPVVRCGTSSFKAVSKCFMLRCAGKKAFIAGVADDQVCNTLNCAQSIKQGCWLMPAIITRCSWHKHEQYKPLDAQRDLVSRSDSVCCHGRIPIKAQDYSCRDLGGQ